MNQPYFDMSDPRSAVWTIQQMLLALSRVDTEVPRVNPTGYYDADTRYAVAGFQRSRGLPETGEMDPETFNRLVADYDRLMEERGKSEGIYPFERRLKDGVVSPGDRFDLVMVIQIMLQTIGIVFDEITVSEINGDYNAETQHNIEVFQRFNQLKETGIVDQITWNRLARLYNALVDAD